MAGTTPDIGRLGNVFAALGSPARLELLSQLSQPRRLTDIRLRAHRSRWGENPERRVSRQAVAMHVAKLREVGIVVEATSADGRAGYVVHAAGIDALIEELREVRRRLPATPSPPAARVVPVN